MVSVCASFKKWPIDLRTRFYSQPVNTESGMEARGFNNLQCTVFGRPTGVENVMKEDDEPVEGKAEDEA